MGFWRLVLSFAPWILFKICASLPLSGKVTMVKAGIVLAGSVCVLQAWKGLNKGIILWGGLLFFGFGLVAVVFLANVWVMVHLGVLSHARWPA